MKKNKIILFATLLLSLTLVFAGSAFYVSATQDNDIICNGVYIDEVNVSGMTRAEAEAAVGSFVEGLRKKSVTISVQDNMVITTLGDLGYAQEVNSNIDEAFELGKSGNLIKRYKDLKDIEEGQMVFPLAFTVDESKIRDLVTVDCGAYNIAPVNATVSRSDNKFKYTDHKLGRKVEVEQTTAMIKDAILNDWNRKDLKIDAAMVDDIPVYTRDIVEKCDTILGTFTTDFSSSAEGRAANLANGAKLINNTVLYPGDVFSGYQYLTPFTVENGYHVAGAYLDGKVVDSIGGGACQVTTTLYNAVLFAELEIVERSAHSMIVSYVDLSRDAAIAGTYKDFKFKNNMDVPICIEAYTVGRKITFNIWGNETRDTANRKLEFVSVELSKTEPAKDIITKDKKQPTTYNKVTQSAHIGYKAELYKVIYEGGVEVSRVRLNKSSYAASARRVTVGTKVVIDPPKDPVVTIPPVEEPPVIEDEPLEDIQPNAIDSEFWDESWDNEGYEDE